MSGPADAHASQSWSSRYVSPGKMYLVAGGAIAIAVAASTAMLALHMSSETESRKTLEKQVDALKDSVEDGFREVRADIKALLRGK